MLENISEAIGKKEYCFDGKAQFKIIPGKKYLFSKGFGSYLVRFGADEIQMSKNFFNEYFKECRSFK